MKKQPKKQVDYLVVGQGLAGSLLSWTLMKQGVRVQVINQYDSQAASFIAGGIFSPITGQRIAKIWQADDIYPALFSFYQELEQELKTSFFYPVPYIKLLTTPELQTFAQRRLDDPAYNQFVTSIDYRVNGQSIDALELQKTGWVDTAKLLRAFQAYLGQHDAYMHGWFDAHQLEVADDKIIYQDITAKRIIFANGLQATQNQFFAHHRFLPTKGELLTVKMNIKLEHILGSHIFILPLGNNLFHVGATFTRTFDDSQPTSAAREWLCSQLEHLIDVPYEIIEHKAGIRPTTPGHRPIVGWHEQYKNIGLFTGFGSKGISYIPYCAQQLLRQIQL